MRQCMHQIGQYILDFVMCMCEWRVSFLWFQPFIIFIEWLLLLRSIADDTFQSIRAFSKSSLHEHNTCFNSLHLFIPDKIRVSVYWRDLQMIVMKLWWMLFHFPCTHPCALHTYTVNLNRIISSFSYYSFFTMLRCVEISRKNSIFHAQFAQCFIILLSFSLFSTIRSFMDRIFSSSFLLLCQPYYIYYM